MNALFTPPSFPMQPGTKWPFCVNMLYCCSQKYIAAASFVTHEVHCTRNTVLCPQCMQPVLKADVEEHVADVHTSAKCPCCQTMATRKEIRECHRLSQCAECSQELAACVLEQHVIQKHSHATCPRCLKVVKKIDLDQHQVHDRHAHQAGLSSLSNYLPIDVTPYCKIEIRVWSWKGSTWC